MGTKKYINLDNMAKIIEILLEKIDNQTNSINEKLSDYDIVKLGANLGATSLQKHQDISHKADKGVTLASYGILDAYTKDEIDSKVSSVFTYKGSVETLNDLPYKNNVGDLFEVKQESANYAWNGIEWIILGAVIDISNKANYATTLAGYGIKDAYTKTEIDEIIARLQDSEEGHFYKAEENEF